MTAVQIGLEEGRQCSDVVLSLLRYRCRCCVDSRIKSEPDVHTQTLGTGTDSSACALHHHPTEPDDLYMLLFF